MDKNANGTARAGLLKKDAPWIMAIVIIAGLLALNARPHEKPIPRPPHVAKKHATYILPHPKPLDEGQQAAKAACHFRAADADHLNFEVSGFASRIRIPLAIPKLGATSEMKSVEISLYGTARDRGRVNIPRGRAYRYVLFGHETDFILIELEERADGSRVFGFAPYNG
jgi:hypothetical protein